jgi:hypothetical protein
MKLNPRQNASQTLTHAVNFVYEPIRCPVRWSEGIDDIPPWDWTREVSTDFVLHDVGHSKADDRYSEGFDHQDPDTFQEFPRLVRATIKNTKKPVKDVSLVDVFVALKKTRDFRHAVLEAVPQIGLLCHPSSGDLYPNSLAQWQDSVREVCFWNSLISFVILHRRESHESDAPRSKPPWEQETRIPFWDAFRHSLGIEPPSWQEQPHGANFIGAQRGTLDGAGQHGGVVEVVLGGWVTLNPQHPETQRGLQAGTIREPDDLPWLHDHSSSSDMHYLGLCDTAMRITKEAGSFLEFKKAIERHCFEQFFKSASGNLYRSDDINDLTTFKARVGALEGAYLELAGLWGNDGTSVCPQCGTVFIKSKPNKIYCRTACQSQVTSKRHYDSKKR